MNRFIIANPVRNVIRFLWSSKVCAWVLNRFIKNGVHAQESGPGAGRLLRKPDMSCYACASEWAAYRGAALTADRARRYPCNGCIQYSSCDMERPRFCTIYTFMNRFIIANPVRNVIRFLWSSKVCAWVLNRFIKNGVHAQESGPGAGRLLRKPEMSCYACASEWAAYRGAARPGKKE